MLACIVVMHTMYHTGGTVVNFVTLRNLPELVAAIRRRAGEQGSSLNKAVISLLQKSLGKRPRKPERAVYHDLDALAGSWSKEEVSRCEAALRDQRAICRTLPNGVAGDRGLLRTWTMSFTICPAITIRCEEEPAGSRGDLAPDSSS